MFLLNFCLSKTKEFFKFVSRRSGAIRKHTRRDRAEWFVKKIFITHVSSACVSSWAFEIRTEADCLKIQETPNEDEFQSRFWGVERLRKKQRKN